MPGGQGRRLPLVQGAGAGAAVPGGVRGPAEPGHGDVVVLPQLGDVPQTQGVLPRRSEAHPHVRDQEGGSADQTLSDKYVLNLLGWRMF